MCASYDLLTFAKIPDKNNDRELNLKNVTHFWNLGARILRIFYPLPISCHGYFYENILL